MKKRNIHIIIASTLFGILVWLSVALREEYTVTVSAPLLIQDIPAGWAISTPVPRMLQLRFQADGWRLAGLLLGPDIQIRFSYNSFSSPVRAITFSDLSDNIGSRAGTRLVDAKPDSIVIDIDKFMERVVPIAPDYSILFKDGYGQIGPARISPESVVIGGARSVLQHIHNWPTVRTTFRDVRVPIDTNLPLSGSDMYSLSFQQRSVHLKVNVQPFAERVISGVLVQCISVPSNTEVILIPPKIELVVRGGIEQLSSLTTEDLRVWIDYQSILADSTGIIDVHTSSPGGIQIVQKRPERLQYIVRKRL